jgi:3-hydroxyacyl-CoA dehydrogenase
MGGSTTGIVAGRKGSWIMEQVLVVGAGFMGAGIAQVCAQAGYRVHLADEDGPALTRALEAVRWSLEKLASKEVLTQDPAAVFGRIAAATGVEAASECAWVVEAVYEDETLKRGLFERLDRLAGPQAVLATNTSSIPVTRLAEATRHPERVLGLHFFGPVPFMGLVEVVKGERTSEEVFERGVAFVRSIGKKPVAVRRDIPGFVMNRIFSAAFRECCDLVADGIATVADIDEGMRLAYGWNIGPFEIADNAGLDTFLRVGRSLQALGAGHIADRAGLIEKLVTEGRLGRKTGEGFYRYDEKGRKLPREDA